MEHHHELGHGFVQCEITGAYHNTWQQIMHHLVTDDLPNYETSSFTLLCQRLQFATVKIVDFIVAI